MDEETLKRGLDLELQTVRCGEKSQEIAEVNQEYKGEQKSLPAVLPFFKKQDETAQKEEDPQTFPQGKIRHLIPKSLKDHGTAFPSQENKRQIILG